MKIIIDIPEEVLDEIYNKNYYSLKGKEALRVAVRGGTPLPKGHGRLGDLDSIMKNINDSINEMTNIGISVDGDYLWAKLNDAIYNASTIIPADKEGGAHTKG